MFASISVPDIFSKAASIASLVLASSFLQTTIKARYTGRVFRTSGIQAFSKQE